MSRITRQQYDEIVTCYEEATSRGHNSIGGWHSLLVAAVISAGYRVTSYVQAKRIAEDVIRGALELVK